jgi:hypothetical protein
MLLKLWIANFNDKDILMKHKISMLFFGAVCTLGSYAAQASLISYDFKQNTGFVINTVQNTNGTDSGLKYASSGLGNDDFDVNVIDTVSWGYNDLAGGSLEWYNGNGDGSGDSYSGLRFLGKTGTVVEGGGWATLTELYHDNNTLAEGALSLASLNIRTLTEFFAPGTNNLLFSDSSNDTPLTFTETLNQQPCEKPGGNPCADNFSIVDIFAPVSLGNGLQLEFRTNPFDNAIVTDEGGKVKVWTEEDRVSRVDVEMRLVRVPEPSSFFLFGSMLLGLAVMKTSRKN